MLNLFGEKLQIRKIQWFIRAFIRIVYLDY